MKTKSDNIIIKTGKTLLRLVLRCLPFAVVFLAAVLIILPLSKKISAKKTHLEQKKSRERTEKRKPANVVTMKIAPGMVMEKLSFPGTAEPWVSLDVVSEARGKVVSKKTGNGRHVKKGDILAVIDQSDYKNARDSALASYETAQAHLKRLKALVKKQFVANSQLDDAVARVKTTKAALENAQLNLKRCFIRSPMKGIVDNVYIENGTLLEPGKPVAHIIQIDRLKIVVGIPESDVDAVRNLKTFQISIDALDGKKFEGGFHYLYKTASPAAHLYNLEIRLDNKKGRVLPGMFARVRIIKNQDPEGLAVPMYSLVNRNERMGVFVEKKGTVRFRPVTRGFQDGWKIQIPQGLDPGDNVVVVGQRTVEHNEKVNVTESIRDMEALHP